MDAAELAAHCCTVNAGVLAVLLLERDEEVVRLRMAGARALLARKRAGELLDLWDLTEATAFQIVDLMKNRKSAAEGASAALNVRLGSSVPGREERG